MSRRSCPSTDGNVTLIRDDLCVVVRAPSSLLLFAFHASAKSPSHRSSNPGRNCSGLHASRAPCQRIVTCSHRCSARALGSNRLLPPDAELHGFTVKANVHNRPRGIARLRAKNIDARPVPIVGHAIRYQLSTQRRRQNDVEIPGLPRRRNSAYPEERERPRKGSSIVRPRR